MLKLYSLGVVLFVIVIFMAMSNTNAQVIEATDSDFDEKVKNGISLVAMVASWCGHCKALHGPYEKAANALGGVVNLVRIDADQNRGVASKYEVRGFPTLKYFKDGLVLKDYNGPRTAKGIVDDAISVFNQQTDSTSELKDLKSAQTFLNQSPSRAKVVLFATKDKVPNLFKSLALESDAMDFGWVSGSAPEDIKEFLKVDQAPKIVVVQAQQEEESVQDRIQEYDGKLKKYPIQKWLEQFKTVAKKEPVKQPEPELFDKPTEATDFSAVQQKCESMCFIGFVGEDTSVFNEVARKYIGEGHSFFWVQEDKLGLQEKFGVDQPTDGSVTLVAYRAKKRKYAVVTGIEGLEQAGKDFFDKIAEGGMRYKRMAKTSKVEL